MHNNITWMDADHYTKYRVPMLSNFTNDSQGSPQAKDQMFVYPAFQNMPRQQNYSEIETESTLCHQNQIMGHKEESQQFRRIDNQVFFTSENYGMNSQSIKYCMNENKHLLVSRNDVFNYEGNISNPQCRAVTQLTSDITIVQSDSDNTIHQIHQVSSTIVQNNGYDHDSTTPFVSNMQHHNFQPSLQNQHEMEVLRTSYLQNRTRVIVELEKYESEFGRVRVEEHKGTLKYSCTSGKVKEELDKKYLELLQSKTCMLQYGKDVSSIEQKLMELEKEYQDFRFAQKNYRQKYLLMLHEKRSIFNTFPFIMNRFIMVELLGKGGSAEVWKVHDYVTNRILALKISLIPKMGISEYTKHSQLFHENIVNLEGELIQFQHIGKVYEAIPMEYQDTDLKKVLEEQAEGRLPEKVAKGLLRQLLDAIVYLHNEAWVAHFDLKPGNILLSNEGHLKLTDFHLSRDKNSPFIISEEGTIKFLPPEFFARKSGNYEKVDIWAIGIIFYTMLYGFHPICSTGISPEMFRQQIQSFSNESLNFPEYPPVSNSAKNIIAACLSTQNECRPDASTLRQNDYFFSP